VKAFGNITCGKYRLSRRLMIASLGLVTFAVQACSNDMTEEHERVCRQNKKIIVHDAKLWREFRALSEAAHQREVRQTPPIKWRPLYVGVEGFEVYFGNDKTYFRSSADDKIVRDDLFIMNGKKIVVQIVDYTYSYRVMGTQTGLNCLKYYDELIIGNMD